MRVCTVVCTVVIASRVIVHPLAMRVCTVVCTVVIASRVIVHPLAMRVVDRVIVPLDDCSCC